MSYIQGFEAGFDGLRLTPGASAEFRAGFRAGSRAWALLNF